MPVHIHSDILFDVFKFCNRFDINERLEFVDAYWANCIELNESKHFPLYKMDKLWICSLFCALHYSLKAHSETTLSEIFAQCSENCQPKFMPFISDEWPAQRIPFCIYIQRKANDAKCLKKIIMNNCSWKIERPECAHFFLHFKQLCFGEVHMDLFNDPAVTLFLLDCPIFHIHTEKFKIRCTSDPWPFMHVVEMAKQKISLLFDASQRIEHFEMAESALTEEVDNPVLKFCLTGRQYCSELRVEAHQFALLFDLVEAYKFACNLRFAIPVVRLFVPSFSWHRRPFIEHTFVQMFDTSQKLAPFVHRFGYFDTFSTLEKFSCFVQFEENEEDKIAFYEFRTNSDI